MSRFLRKWFVRSDVSTDDEEPPEPTKKGYGSVEYVMPALNNAYDRAYPPDENDEGISPNSKNVELTRKSDVARQYAIASIANLLMLSYGIACGWPSTALPQLMSAAETPLPYGALSVTHATWLASLFCVTGIPIAPFIAILSERRGRKAIGILTGVLHVLSHLVAVIGIHIARAAESHTIAIAALYIARALAGFGTASGFMFTPLYAREISDNATRGPLGVLITLNVNVGTLCAFVFGGYLSFILASWLYTIPSLLFLFAVHWMPETPVYLLRKGKDEEAREALTVLRGEDYDVDEEIAEMKDSLSKMKADSRGGAWSNFKELFGSAAPRKAIFIVVFLMFNKEFSGQFVITSYTYQIFEEAGTTFSSYLSSIIVGFMLIAGTIIAAFLCNILGRKILLILSNLIMSVTLFGMGMYFYLQYLDRDLSHVAWAPITFLSMYVIAYNIGLGPLPLVFLTELFSPKLVSTAMILIGPIPGILAFLTGKFVYQVAKAIGLYSCFWGCAAVCIIGILFVILVIPETKNRPLDEIQKMLGGGPKENDWEQEQNIDNEMTDVLLTDVPSRGRAPLMTDF